MEERIYRYLVAAGMSPAGACGFMGNMNAESAMRPDNAQDGMTSMSDSQYTAAVDNGTYSNFVGDAVGYGLCQWTFHTRKAALLAYCKSRGLSIGDAGGQCGFAVQELKQDYPSLWAYLCITQDVSTAASRVCTEYERPAVNNISVRANAALKYLGRFGSLPVTVDDPAINTGKTIDMGAVPQTAEGYWPPRVLCEGMSGPDVAVIKALLSARGMAYNCDIDINGKFDGRLTVLVTNFQASCGLAADGIVGNQTWSKLLQR